MPTLIATLPDGTRIKINGPLKLEAYEGKLEAYDGRPVGSPALASYTLDLGFHRGTSVSAQSSRNGCSMTQPYKDSGYSIQLDLKPA